MPLPLFLQHILAVNFAMLHDILRYVLPHDILAVGTVCPPIHFPADQHSIYMYIHSIQIIQLDR